ncbi:MAG: hypothetical protein V5A38_10130 [Halolamina sp.]|uniref:hypothetical protein n=1 Tax=Halolamina sp. TaxID=1940283 RepID=UPI002FC3312F
MSAASTQLSRTLVLNGLRDLSGGRRVLEDDASRETVRKAFEAALHVAERDRFRTEMENASTDGLDEEGERFVERCADDVLAELVEDGVRATLVHEAVLTMPADEAAVYSFMVSHDPETLSGVPVDGEAREKLVHGAEAVADAEFDRAVDAFDDAVSASAGGDGSLATRVLAGYACHLAGRDSDAIHYVEETLHLDTGVHTAKLVGYAADHRYPEKFRSGKLGARLFFRWSTSLPEFGEVTVAAGPADGAPTPLEGSEECKPLPRLWPETTIQVRVSGDLPELPPVESYYVASGVADLEVYEARSVEEMLLSGPTDTEAEERLRFE